MVLTGKNVHFHQVLSADGRFNLPDVSNDQVWEVKNTESQPRALSIFTTYGLRANRMQIFPVFTIDDRVVQDPAEYFNPPGILFSSGSFLTLRFSPFQGIDAICRLWVPTSQVIMGELTCFNSTNLTRTLGVDWFVQLNPITGGSPMKHVEMGLSTVLQGECADLHPVFYMAGGAFQSTAVFPGLAARLLLMPGSKKLVTWSMASLSSFEASFQTARQYSSKSLENEELKVEMADRREIRVNINARTKLRQVLQLGSIRAAQLVMPPIRRYSSSCYMISRDSSTGFYPRPDIIEINPPWNGETLPGIWQMSQILLPGRPEAIKGFLQNFLKQQQADGTLDFCISPNGNRTGYSAPPLLAQLVADLHPYLQDLTWLEGIYPQLIAFLKTWAHLDDSGKLTLEKYEHPVQLAFDYSDPRSEHLSSDFWIRLQTSDDLIAPFLIYREVCDLLQIASWLKKAPDQEELEKIRTALFTHLTVALSDPDRTPDKNNSPRTEGLIVHQYRRNGVFRPRKRLLHTSKVYARLTGEGHVPSGFSCLVKGKNGNETVEFTIRKPDLLSIGLDQIFVSFVNFSSVEEVVLKELPSGFSLEIGQAGLQPKNATHLLSLYAGVMEPRQAENLLRTSPVKDFLSDEYGFLLTPAAKGCHLSMPSYLVGLIMEGLLRYGKTTLAEQLFRCHFMNRVFSRQTSKEHLLMTSLRSLEDLAPLRIFLKIRGLVRVTNNEVILSHFIKQKRDSLTVQYNKMELRLNPYITEIHTQSGEVIYLNRAGPNRVILE